MTVCVPGHQRVEEDGEGFGSRGVQEKEGDEEEVMATFILHRYTQQFKVLVTIVDMHGQMYTYTLSIKAYRVTNGRIRAAACFSQGAPARAFTSNSRGSML